MVRSPSSDLRALRAQVVTLAGGLCEWPKCGKHGEEMAHLQHRQMGGSRKVNTIDNVAWLCKFHHDLLDGRTSMDRFELRTLLNVYLGVQRRAQGFDA